MESSHRTLPYGTRDELFTTPDGSLRGYDDPPRGIVVLAYLASNYTNQMVVSSWFKHTSVTNHCHETRNI